MDDKQKKKIKSRITEAIDETCRDIDSLTELARPVAPDNAIGRLSRMDAISNRSINEAALRRAQSRLEQLRTVLDKLDDPDFGSCVECDEQIPLGRIMLMPESRMCVRCAAEFEK